MPRETFPAGVRVPIVQHVSEFINAGTVSPDFNAATGATIAGGAGGIIVPFKCQVEALEFLVGPEDFAGAGGTLTFELRRDSTTGTVLATLTITLAAALRGVQLRATVPASAAEAAKLKDNDKLFLMRVATGTVFTTGRGVFRVQAWQRPQAKQ